MPRERLYEYRNGRWESASQRHEMLWFPQEYQGTFIEPSWVAEPANRAALVAGVLSAETVRVPVLPIQANPSFDMRTPRKPILPRLAATVGGAESKSAEKILDAIIQSRR